MTTALAGPDVAKIINARFAASFADVIVENDQESVVIKSEYLLEVLSYLKNAKETAFDYLTDLTAVDYRDYFEVVYRLTCLEQNHSAVIKTRCADRSQAILPSVTGLWRGADLMEREIFDLMGIRFTGHSNLKRIFLWEGFAGYPLRKDYL